MDAERQGQRPEPVVFRNIHRYIHIHIHVHHVTTINEKRGYEFERVQGGVYGGGFKEKRGKEDMMLIANDLKK